jgi:WD40 repeat protein
MLIHKRVAYLSYSNSNSITSWDYLTGDILRTFKGHNDSITALYISSTSNSNNTLYSNGIHSDIIFTASADKRVIISDIDTGERIQTLSGHTKSITTMLYHSHIEKENDVEITKKMLYTGSADCTVIAWEWVPDVNFQERSRFTLKCKYTGHKSSITSLAAKNSMIYNMRYDLLFIAALDGSVRAIDIEVTFLHFLNNFVLDWKMFVHFT